MVGAVMNNPLRKRLFAQLKADAVRHIVIFIFLAGMIALISGFLATDRSVYKTYNEGVEKYNLEHGHFEVAVKPDKEAVKNIEKKEKVEIYKNWYKDEEVEGNSSTLRIYANRKTVDKVAVFEGSLPDEENEIALDRLYAENSSISIGDKVTVNGKQFEVSGLVAFVDYSSLFENNTDMMFEARNFGVGVTTQKGFERISDRHIHYAYAWKYKNNPSDEAQEKDWGDDLRETIKDETEIMGMITLTEFLPAYLNHAITFAVKDMDSDKASFSMFFYIVLVVISFIFAITANAAIRREAGVIGTLRATGYRKSELICHYMALPVIVTIVASIAGNILGYTVLSDKFQGIYFTNYCLAPYEQSFNWPCFIQTTVVPFIIMLVINLALLVYKLRLSPMRFLRRNLSSRHKKKLMRLPAKWSFMARYRIRVIANNIGSYIVLAIGVLLASLIMVFGFMWTPLMNDYTDEIKSSMVADYQYVLKAPVDVDSDSAEKYAVTELVTEEGGRFKSEEITVYGISKDSSYVDISFGDGVYISNGFADKYGYDVGDTITLCKEYEDDTYEFKVDGIYQYTAAISVFMPRSDFIDTFDKKPGYYNGYFSSSKIKDIDEDYVANILTAKDYTKIADQMNGSLGEMVNMFKYLGFIMFIALVFLLSKVVIDKNSQSISMTKVLGYSRREIGGIYVAATSIVAIAALILSMPVADVLLKWVFHSYMYTVIEGYIPYLVAPSVFLKTVVSGIICYAIVILSQLWRIGRIPGAEAIKNME